MSALCKICEKPTPLRDTYRCQLCTALLFILVNYEPEARELLEKAVVRESLAQ